MPSRLSSADSSDRWPLILLFAVTAIWLSLLCFHVPGVNGPVYWSPPWQRLSTARVVLTLSIASAPLWIALATARRSPLPITLLLIMLAGFAMQIAAISAADPWPPTLHTMADAIRAPDASYYADARTYLWSRDQGHGSLREFLAGFPALMPRLHPHTRIRAPGVLLAHVPLMDAIGPGENAARAIGLAIGVLAMLSVPATYGLVRLLSANRTAALYAAAFFTLTPAFVLQFPTVDQIYPAVACALIALWIGALRSGRVRYAVAFGLILAATCFFAYNVLVLGIFLGGLTGLAVYRDGLTRRRAAALSTAAVAAFLAFHLTLWLTTGFNAWAVFHTALQNQREFMQGHARPWRMTVYWDLLEFAAGTGWVGIVLAAYYFVRQSNTESARQRSLCWLAVGQIVLMALLGILPAETARVWLFLLPLLMLPIGLELSRWRPAAAAAVLICLWLVTAAACQNLIPRDPAPHPALEPPASR